MRMLAVVCAGTTNGPWGKATGSEIPAVRTARPGAITVISIGGSESASSCQLFGASASQRWDESTVSLLNAPRPRGAALAQFAFGLCVFQDQSNKPAFSHSPGSAT